MVSYTRATEYWNSSCEHLSFQAAIILRPSKSALHFHSDVIERICKGLIQAHIF